MLEIKHSTTGALQYLTPHVYYQLIDNSAIQLPNIGYSGVGLYVPFYSEKGPINEIKIFGGANGFAKLLDTYGRPDVRRYGLPYSAAVLHAQNGGSVIAQNIKAPNAAHATMVVNMTIKRAYHYNYIGYVYDNAAPTAANGYSEAGVYKQWTEADAQEVANNGDPNDARRSRQVGKYYNKFSNEALEQQYVSEQAGNALYKQIDKSFENQENKEAIRQELKKRWKKVAIQPIHIGFEDVKIKSVIEAEKQKKGAVLPFSSVNSWETLDLLVHNYVGTARLTTPLDYVNNKLLSNQPPREDDVYSVPIVWGICTGKGEYGNAYAMQFSSTTVDSDVAGRPTLLTSIMDTKYGQYVPNSQKISSFNNDAINGQSIFLESVYNSDNFDGDFKIGVASKGTFDDLGRIIYEGLKHTFGITYKGGPEDDVRSYSLKLRTVTDKATDSSIENRGTVVVEPIFNKGTSYGTAGDVLLRDMVQELLEFRETEDSSLHRLSKMDFTRLADKLGISKAGGLQKGTFTGGDEGELKFMKEFSWKFNFLDPKLVGRYGYDPTKEIVDMIKRDEIPANILSIYEGSQSSPQFTKLPSRLKADDMMGHLKKWDPEFLYFAIKWKDTKIVENMFIDAYSSKLNIENTSLLANPADYMIDLGFPNNVKAAMYNFGVQSRTDIQMLFNTSMDTYSVDEARSEKGSLNYEGRNVYWFTGSFEWVDPYSSRSVRTPLTFGLIPILLDHYTNGFSQSIAGIQRGLLSMVKRNTTTGIGNGTLEQNDKLYKDRINVLSVYSNNVLYLDSQIANYGKKGTISSLNEFHNNSIVNRILKLLFLKLQEYKHIIVSDNSAARIQEIINRELQVFSDKVAVLEYKAEFTNTYEKALGLLTHSLRIQFNNTIKYHFIKLEAMPIT